MILVTRSATTASLRRKSPTTNIAQDPLQRSISNNDLFTVSSKPFISHTVSWHNYYWYRYFPCNTFSVFGGTTNCIRTALIVSLKAISQVAHERYTATNRYVRPDPRLTVNWMNITWRWLAVLVYLPEMLPLLLWAMNSFIKSDLMVNLCGGAVPCVPEPQIQYSGCWSFGSFSYLPDLPCSPGGWCLTT